MWPVVAVGTVFILLYWGSCCVKSGFLLSDLHPGVSGSPLQRQQAVCSPVVKPFMLQYIIYVCSSPFNTTFSYVNYVTIYVYLQHIKCLLPFEFLS